tara:strand:- start:1059 stop:1934 length:876 start_codon:yes stop_codon:yes gene_type:complete
MKTKFIVNPIAGLGKQKNIKKILDRYLDKNRFNFDIIYTEKHLHAKELAKQAVKEKYDLIISVGGDGTLNQISSELIGTNVAIGVIPAGSGNGFGLHFGIKKNIKKAVKQLNNSEIKKVDTATANGIPFVNVSGVGFDAHIAKLFSTLKKRGLINYLKLIVQELNYKSKEYNIEFEDKVRKLNAILISFANASQYGNNFKISPNSNIEDGLLDFVIVKDLPKWEIPFLLFKIAIGKANKCKYIEIIRTKKMKITSSENIIHLDGEPKQINTSIEVICNKSSLYIFVPNGKK